MTEVTKRPVAEGAGGGSPPPSPPSKGSRHVSRGWVAAIVVLAVAVVVGVVVAVTAGGSSTPAVTTVSLVSQSYTPKAPPGATDDYHCNLVNPHVTKNSYVISSQFEPGSPEDHHAVLALVPPSLASDALRLNARTHDRGWTCFGAPSLPGANLSQFLSTPFLSVWAPGHGADALPKGTGIRLPARSLVIEQVHYNLLAGDKPVRNSLVLDTVPASTPLLPLHLDLALAPPDLPCPPGVTGPLCNRAASIANQAKRFGAEAAEIVGGIEALCGHNAAHPPEGDTATCIFTVDQSGYIVRAQAHMHLLGVSFKMVLNPGTSQARTVLSVPQYNFDYQKAYNLSTPIPVKAGDKLQVSCTYNPRLAQELPQLRRSPPHFVTWGDGSSDEMCIGLAWSSATAPNSHDAL
jgi:hypothetical protein